MSVNMIFSILGGIIGGVSYLVGFLMGHKIGKTSGYNEGWMDRAKLTPGFSIPFLNVRKEEDEA